MIGDLVLFFIVFLEVNLCDIINKCSISGLDFFLRKVKLVVE